MKVIRCTLIIVVAIIVMVTIRIYMDLPSEQKLDAQLTSRLNSLIDSVTPHLDDSDKFLEVVHSKVASPIEFKLSSEAAESLGDFYIIGYREKILRRDYHVFIAYNETGSIILPYWGR